MLNYPAGGILAARAPPSKSIELVDWDHCERTFLQVLQKFLGNTTHRLEIRKALEIRRNDRHSHQINHRVDLEEYRP